MRPTQGRGTESGALHDGLVFAPHGALVADRKATIVQTRGDDGAPPYLIRFASGQETLVLPGPDAVVEHPEQS